jgi:PAS domain S-box-containing protein
MDALTDTLKSTRMSLNRLTLAFSGRHAKLEPVFHDHYFFNTLKQIRIAIFVAIFFYAVFGLMDILVLPDRYRYLWIIRLAIVCPCLSMILWFSYSKHAYDYLQPVLGFIAIVSGLGIVAMILISAPDHNEAYEMGLVQILFYIFTFSRLRFIWGTCAALVLVAIYMTTIMSDTALPNNVIITKGFHFTLVCLMGMMACYAVEYHTRKNFFLSLQLESKKRRLALANKFLEKRVATRTQEQKRTNALLREEINERKIIEAALRESQKRYRRMVDNVTDHMCVYDMQGNILEANRQMAVSLGYALAELTEMKYQDLILPDEHATHFQYMSDIRRSGTALGSLTMVTRKGEQRFFEYSNVLAEHITGKKAVFSLARDITHRKKTEKALADSQLRFKNIFETAAAGMAIIKSQSQRVVEINSAAARMFGIPIDQIKGQRLDSLIVMPGDAAAPRLPLPTPHPVECLLKCTATNYLPVLASTRETVIDDQRHGIISFINIKKIKEAEAVKRDLETRSNRAQHLESIGTLAGGIAHDFNNILFGILGFAELALEDAVENTIQACNLNEILKGGHRAKELIRQILTYSRQDCVEKHVLRPAPLIKEALKLLRASLPSSIEIKRRFAANLHKIHSNPVHIHQLVMNLCTNAAHAMDNSIGRIDICLDNVNIAAKQETAHCCIDKGDYLRLVVKDNGNGIPHEIIDRIYEPFFTTKSQGRGTGMGLSVVLGIVQANGGAIYVHSQPGEGSQFELYFPAAQKKMIEPSSPAAPVLKGHEHILVVDDEPSLLIMLDRILNRLGYEVTTCANACEALTLFRGRPGAYDVVITDLTMPKMTGLHLAREILKTRPDLPIIICTGYADKVSADHIKSIGIRRMLPKPILKTELASAIRQVLSVN